MKVLAITLLFTASAVLASETPPPEPTAPEAGTKSLSHTPARFLAEDLDTRLQDLQQRLAISKRERGPFGLYQVPGKTPVITSPIERAVRKTPFDEFINLIQISVINAREKEFLVGARMFRLGQVFPIELGSERLSVRVEGVTPSQVTFKNLKTGEIALRRLDVLPAGITASADSIRPRGVTSTQRGEVEPLRLDLNAPPTP